MQHQPFSHIFFFLGHKVPLLNVYLVYFLVGPKGPTIH